MDYTELLSRVGGNVKALRKKNGFTQKEMANFGVGQRHMQDIEGGNGNLTLKTLWKLSNAFQLSVPELIGGSRESHPNEYEKGILGQIVACLPVACIVWEHLDSPKEKGFFLKYANEKARELTLSDLNTKAGQSLRSLFPAVEALGFLAFLENVRASGVPGRLEDFVYGDTNVQFGHFSVTAVPVSPTELAVFFDSANEKALLRQAGKIAGTQLLGS